MCFVELPPGEVAVRREPLLVRLGIELGVGHMRGVGQHDDALDRLQLIAKLFDDRKERQVDEEHAVFCVVDDPGDLLGKEPRVDGVIDAAEAEQPVPDLEVPPCVPGKRRGAVAELETVPVEAAGDAPSAGVHLAIVGPVDRPLDRPRDHLAIAVLDRGVVDDLVTKQRPFLHQSAHRSLPRCGDFSLSPAE